MTTVIDGKAFRSKMTQTIEAGMESLGGPRIPLLPGAGTLGVEVVSAGKGCPHLVLSVADLQITLRASMIAKPSPRSALAVISFIMNRQRRPVWTAQRGSAVEDHRSCLHCDATR